MRLHKIFYTLLSNLLDAVIDNSIDKTTYNNKQNTLKSEKLLIQDQLAKLPKETPQTTLDKLKTLKEYCYDLPNMFTAGEECVKQDLLKSVLWKMSIQDKQIASVQYNMLFQRLAEASKSGDLNNWRRGRDSNSRAR